MFSNLTRGFIFAQKRANINVSTSAARQITIVAVSRYYCDVKSSLVNVCAKFH